MIRFITEHRDCFGVALVCRVLRSAVLGFLIPRGHRAAVGPAPSARQLRDDLLAPEVARLHAERYGVYGRWKMRALMRWQGWDISRDQTERLMRLAGVRGVRKATSVVVTGGVYRPPPYTRTDSVRPVERQLATKTPKLEHGWVSIRRATDTSDQASANSSLGAGQARDA